MRGSHKKLFPTTPHVDRKYLMLDTLVLASLSDWYVPIATLRAAHVTGAISSAVLNVLYNNASDWFNVLICCHEISDLNVKFI